MRWLSGLLVLCLFLRLVSFVAIAASLVAPHFSWSFFQSANYTYVLIASGLASRFAPLAELAMAVVWLVWFRAAYRNLRALTGKPLGRSLAWAVLGWILPIVNLVLPYRLLSEVWYESIEQFDPEDDRKFVVVQLWMAAWVGHFLSLLALFIFMRWLWNHQNAYEILQRILAAEAATSAVAIALALVIAREISRKEDHYHETGAVARVFR
ncbi:MAG: DUF4328 domain-containing protein [Candidatus Eisenbacteria bacterium]|uniref:DUF4328 domain-containing protein n=1 Tax=Eiseniibacteriota bacterium TaxID=2212470 RepID=A0A956NLJ8_UNCEI|nr:DUF4328 domain-containing protein [Candidatus Eisenbacteria bacterium]